MLAIILYFAYTHLHYPTEIAKENMPELPEVETVKQGLSPLLVGRTVIKVTVLKPRLRYPVPTTLTEQISGKCIRKIARRSKYLLFYFHDDTVLLAHLGMTGLFVVVPAETPLKKHDHLVFTLDNGFELRYHDPRRFGFIQTTHADTLPDSPFLQHLGAEPLSDGFSAKYLKEKLSTRKIAIKPALMDARVVVGVGNIYASEALFQSGIHPEKPANTLTSAQIGTLANCIQSTLKAAIAAGGSSLPDFSHPDGKPGYFQHQFKVYGNANKPCSVCKSPIHRITQAQRSTFFCPRCQPKA